MPINNPASLLAPVGILKFSTIDSGRAANAGKAGYWDFPDGKWVILSSDDTRTIGNLGSGAALSKSWLFSLFEHIYGIFDLPIYTSTGQISSKDTTSDDWDAGKRLVLPDFRGRAIIGDGTGQAGLYRGKGTLVGAERHTLSIAEMPAHPHPIDFVQYNYAAGGGVINTLASPGSQPNVVNSRNTGSGTPHNNMQPSIVMPIWMSAGTF